jgi:ankyrin repeat protein
VTSSPRTLKCSLNRRLGHGARIDAHDSNGYSVLMNAAERGSPELIGFLISRGAKVNERLSSNHGETRLTIARDRKTPAAVEVLLKAGATDDGSGKE